MDRPLGGHAFFAYATNYLIDLDHAVIVDVEATTPCARPRSAAATTMIDRTAETFGLIPSGWPPTPPTARPRCSPGWSMSGASSRTSRSSTNPQRSDGTFSRDDFTYDHEGDLYTCPAGKELRQRP